MFARRKRNLQIITLERRSFHYKVVVNIKENETRFRNCTYLKALTYMYTIIYVNISLSCSVDAPYIGVAKCDLIIIEL